MIFFEVLRVQEDSKIFIGNDQFARVNGASAEDYLRAIFELSLKIAFVAEAAEGVAALHAHVVGGLLVAAGAAEVLTRISQLAHSLVSLVQIEIKHFSKEFLGIVKVSVQNLIQIPLHLQQKAFREGGRQGKVLT